MAKEENVMTMDMLKAELLSSSKGNFMSVLGESQEGEFLNSTAMDLNRILSGTLNKSVKTLTHTGLVGPEASGKSSIMCLMLADAQKKGYLPVVIDAEGA
jgi:type IV secretory pathway VirB4 component